MTTRPAAELRRQVKGWILEGLLAEKPEGKPQPMSPPAAGRLSELRLRTLVMVGLADEAPSVASGRYLAASVQGARLMEFPNVAHMIHLEEPERFMALALEFLANCPPGRRAGALSTDRAPGRGSPPSSGSRSGD